MRRALRLYVASALVVGLAVFAAAGVGVYVTWSDGPEAKATGTTTVKLAPGVSDDCTFLRWPAGSDWREGVEVPCTPENMEWARREQERIGEPEPCRARCQAAARRKPQAANESCLYRHGRIRWCLTVPAGEEWYVSQYPEPEHRGRYFLHDHRDRVQGYLRPTSYGWRAMVSTLDGWARGGKVVRTGQRSVLYVYDQGKGYTVRGAHAGDVARAVEVAAYKLIYGDCREAWTHRPCRNGMGQ